MISLRNLAEPVTLVRSPMLTNGMSGVSVNGSRPERRSSGARVGGTRGSCAGDRRGDRLDVFGGRAAAAADDVDEPVAREARRSRPPSPPGSRRRGRIRWAGRRWDRRRRRCRRLRRSRRGVRASPQRPSAQLRPIENGRAWRTECQKAVGVWPDSVRPERSVIVPEIISGRRWPRAANASSQAKIAALALSVSKIVSISRMSAPPSIRPRDLLAIGFAQLDRR